jgi:thiol-disulfide isomerase/thioredoxin
MLKSFSHLLACCCLFLSGCQEAEPTTLPSVKTEPDQPEHVRPTVDKVQIEVMSLSELQTILTEQNGRLVICDYWSTSCKPCLQEFPHLVTLHDKYGADKLTCISASLEYDGLPSFPIEKCKAAALEFLVKQKATFKNILFSDETLDVLDTLDVGSMPIVDVYKNGKLLKRFVDTADEEFSYQNQVIPFVEQQLAEE